jgi:hypothetical protein
MPKRTRGQVTFSDVTSSSGAVYLGSSTAVETKALVDIPQPAQSERRSQGGPDIESAVYSHIQAVRALGKTTVETADIASALSLPVAAVNRAIQRLRSRGVRPLAR